MKLFSQFLKNPKHTGSVLPSQPELCRRLADAAQIATADVIVEFGAGTGVVTEEIIRRKKPEARLISIEINADLAKRAQQRCPEAEVVVGDAAKAKEILQTLGIHQCDCIVSALPWAIFPAETQDDLLGAAYDILKPGGAFVTFAYLQGLILPAAKRFKLKLHGTFSLVSVSSVVWLNIPPALVYLAAKMG